MGARRGGRRVAWAPSPELVQVRKSEARSKVRQARSEPSLARYGAPPAAARWPSRVRA